MVRNADRKHECSYCGAARDDKDLALVKVSVGSDLYFCRDAVGNAMLYSCTEEVLSSLNNN